MGKFKRARMLAEINRRNELRKHGIFNVPVNPPPANKPEALAPIVRIADMPRVKRFECVDNLTDAERATLVVGAKEAESSYADRGD